MLAHCLSDGITFGITESYAPIPTPFGGDLSHQLYMHMVDICDKVKSDLQSIRQWDRSCVARVCALPVRRLGRRCRSDYMFPRTCLRAPPGVRFAVVTSQTPAVASPRCVATCKPQRRTIHTICTFEAARVEGFRRSPHLLCCSPTHPTPPHSWVCYRRRRNNSPDSHATRRPT